MTKRTDPAHKWTDEEIKRIENEISKEYKQAHEEAVKKTKAYFKDFERKDKEWRELVEAGKVTEKEYLTWRKGQMLVGKRWEGLCETLAEDYLNAAEIAMSICKEHAPEVYAVNHNYTTFECEQGSGMDTSYTLYSRETVERMYREDPKLYHDYGKAVAKDIKEGRQIAWDKKRVKSVLTQAVLQGESIPKITKRLEIITGGDHKAAIRNARTMMTGVQNAGRIDAMKRANDLGIPTKKQWLATVDNRTRHWHRELDGVIKDIDEPFENSVGKIMYPADPEASGANVYNCRCTLLSAIKGFELDVTDPSIRPMPKLGDMSYEEWRSEKVRESSNSEWGRFKGFGTATREEASADWFEYENANAMSEFIRTGRMPTKDMNGIKIPEEKRVRLAHEANLIQAEGTAINTGQKTLFRGMVMSEEEARAISPHTQYVMETLTATTPDRKIAKIYMDVDNYGGGEGVPVILEIQKPDGIHGFKRDEKETVLPKDASFNVVRNYMDEDGVVHISLYAKKSKRKRTKA